jgi:tetratricopeptide (TPR) repeat protein
MSNRLDQLIQMQQGTPDDAFLLFAIAKEYEKLGQAEMALQWYLDLIQKDPDYVGTYYHLGKLYEQLEQPTQAFQTYAGGMAVARKQNDQHSLSELKGAQLNLGDEADFE